MRVVARITPLAQPITVEIPGVKTSAEDTVIATDDLATLPFLSHTLNLSRKLGDLLFRQLEVAPETAMS